MVHSHYLCLRLPLAAAFSILLLQTDPSPVPVRAPSTLPPAEYLCQTLEPFPNFTKAAHVNAQSLLCHFDEFTTIFGSNIFDLILISETWLKPHINNKSIELQGYSVYRNDRLHKGGGGVMIYVKSHLPTNVLYVSDTSREGRPEYMFLDVSVNGTHFLVSVCYRAPNLRYLSEYEEVLLDLMPRYSHVLVMGDLNIDLLGTVTHDQRYLTAMFHSCNMTILPLDATHHTATTDTWLDIMAVTDPTLVAHHGQTHAPGLSKHDLIFIVYKLRPPKSKHNFIQYRNYSAINHYALLSDAATLPWNEVIESQNVDLMVEKFNLFLTDLFNKHAPFIKKRVTKGPAPWLTDYIRLLQRRRDSAFRHAKRTKSNQDWALYKRLRNMTQQQIRNSKTRFYYTYFSRKLSTKVLWSKLKELGIGQSRCDPQISFDLNTLNDFFVNIPVDMSGACSYAAELESTPFVPAHQFNFSPVMESDVRKAVIRITSGAVGADNIPIRFIRDTLPVTLPIITFIFNTSLRSCIFPSIWKCAVVRPLQKCSSPQSPSDFRPISILSALSKCLERVVHQQFISFLDENMILSRYQSGFRSHHSTTTALLRITDDIRLAMDKRLLSILTLFDFSKAFDCVYHPLLLVKLKMAGFSFGCVNWVESYLTGRHQLVRSGDAESGWKPVTRGVPQGSVLGPLLFSIYINDVTDTILHSKFHLYADDLQIYYHFPVKDSFHAVSMINLDITSITRWAKRNGLKLNETKTQTMVLGTPRLLSQVDFLTFPKLRLNNIELDYSDKVKNLGLIINKSLTWHETTTATCNRVFACIHSLKRFALFLPFNVKKMLVKTLALPHFNYCDVVTSDMTVELSNRLQRAQNYCIRFIFNLRRNDHVTPYFEQLSLLKLKPLREYHILTLLHTILSLKAPPYLSDEFIFMAQISFRNTRRGALLLSIPQHRSTIYSNSFVVTSCRLWNALPDSVKTIETRARFGAVVRDGMLRGLW